MISNVNNGEPNYLNKDLGRVNSQRELLEKIELIFSEINPFQNLELKCKFSSLQDKEPFLIRFMNNTSGKQIVHADVELDLSSEGSSELKLLTEDELCSGINTRTEATGCLPLKSFCCMDFSEGLKRIFKKNITRLDLINHFAAAYISASAIVMTELEARQNGLLSGVWTL